MPVHPVKKDGKTVGWEWGSRGKIYRGKKGRQKAAAQGYAAMKRGYREKGMSEAEQAKKLYGG